jgi:sigma-B regulation protein RsbU (phosphoserine phosphatase)
LEPASRSLVYSSAGHCTGFILNRQGQLRRKLESTDIPIGVCPEYNFACSEVIGLEPGDIILLLTDGVLEALSPDDSRFGVDRALAIVRLYREWSAQQIVFNLYHAVRAFTWYAPQVDDISALVIKVRDR